MRTPLPYIQTYYFLFAVHSVIIITVISLATNDVIHCQAGYVICFKQ